LSPDSVIIQRLFQPLKTWVFTGIDPGRLDEGGIAASPGGPFACFFNVLVEYAQRNN